MAIAMERSTIFHGKIHYFDWAIFNSYVSHYQRVGKRPKPTCVPSPKLAEVDASPAS
jgi:hypothetical protein